MAEVCNKCGKSAVVDSAGNCFHCSDVDGKKYKNKKMVIPNKILGFIYVIGVLVNVVIGYKYIYDAMQFNFFPMIFFMGFICVTWFYISKAVFSKIHLRWGTSIIGLVLNIVLMLILPTPLRPSFGYRILVDALFVISICIAMGISMLFGFKKWPTYREMNNILDNEKKLTKNISQIPKYAGEYTKEQYDQYFYEELNRAIELVEELDIDEVDKQKTIQMLQNRGEIKSDVGGKFGYLSIIKMLLEDGFRLTNKGKFINEITFDRNAGILPIYNPTSINGYVTENYFNLCNRIENEINKPYNNYFLRRSYELEINEWFRNFRSEYNNIKNGYVGEGRVAESLKKYEEQVIILPNIRIEVDGESSEMDYIVISPYGVYSLEVKNLAETGAYDVLIEKDGRWNKIKKGVKKPMKSPDTQNERHIVHLETMINRALGRNLDDYIRVKGMIVIANDQVTIKNYNDDCIVKRYDYVMQAIRQNDIVLKESEMKQIATAIKDAELEHKPYSLEFKGNYFDTYFAIKMLMSEYMYWKEGNQELFDYVTEYRTKVYKPIQETEAQEYNE